MLYAIILTSAVFCAFLTIRARQLIVSALWLAGTSALTSICLYALGAKMAAMIELSVGAGLVTVLFVFAISIAGDDALKADAFISGRLVAALVIAFALLLAWMVLPLDDTSRLTPALAGETTFSEVVWGDRALDTLLQLVLIFVGVLCLLGLLTDEKPPHADDTITIRNPAAIALARPNALPDLTSPHDVSVPTEPHSTEPQKEKVIL